MKIVVAIAPLPPIRAVVRSVLSSTFLSITAINAVKNSMTYIRSMTKNSVRGA
jgi:hypothetical protein